MHDRRGQRTVQCTTAEVRERESLSFITRLHSLRPATDTWLSSLLISPPPLSYCHFQPLPLSPPSSLRPFVLASSLPPSHYSQLLPLSLFPLPSSLFPLPSPLSPLPSPLSPPTLSFPSLHSLLLPSLVMSASPVPKCFGCTHCPSTFTKNDNLTNHIEEKHADKCPHQCVFCDARFHNEKRFIAHTSLRSCTKPTTSSTPPIEGASLPGPDDNPLDFLPGVADFYDSRDSTNGEKTNLRRLLEDSALVHGRPAAGLSDAVKEGVIKWKICYLNEHCGADRSYQVTLLQKQIMEHLARVQSRNTQKLYSPEDFPMWREVCRINKKANKERKKNREDNAAGLNAKTQRQDSERGADARHHQRHPGGHGEAGGTSPRQRIVD